MSLLNIGRGFTAAKYWIAPTFHGRYPVSLAKFNEVMGGVSHPSNLAVTDTMSVSVAIIAGKTREGHVVMFEKVEFLKAKDGVYTFAATLSADCVCPPLLRKFLKRDDIYVTGRFSFASNGETVRLYGFEDIQFHGVGKKAMNFIRGTELCGYGLTGVRCNIVKK